MLVRDAITVAVWALCSVTLSLYNKFLYQTHLFVYPVFLTLIHQAATACVSVALMDENSTPKRPRIMIGLGLALALILNIVGNNMALVVLDVSNVQVGSRAPREGIN